MLTTPSQPVSKSLWHGRKWDHHTRCKIWWHFSLVAIPALSFSHDARSTRHPAGPTATPLYPPKSRARRLLHHCHAVGRSSQPSTQSWSNTTPMCSASPSAYPCHYCLHSHVTRSSIEWCKSTELTINGSRPGRRDTPCQISWPRFETAPRGSYTTLRDMLWIPHQMTTTTTTEETCSDGVVDNAAGEGL